MSNPTPGALTHRQTLTVLSGLMLGMLLAGLDQTIVATAARTIGDDLGGLDQQAWLTTAFLITSTITTLLYGKLSDVFGRKRLYMLAITLFLIGSVLCGIATSMPMLAVFRGVQGLGAGLPTVAGITGWRWVFWVNLPVGIAALIIIAKTLHVDQVLRRPRIDFLGAVFLAIAVVPALLVGEQGSTWGWMSLASIICYVLAGVGAAAFITEQFRMGDNALLPLTLFRNRAFSIPTLLAFTLGIVQLGGIAVIPLYLQIVHGANPTQAGLLMLPMVLGISAASVLAGWYTSKTGRYKILPVIGMAQLTVAFIGLSTVETKTSLVVVDAWMLAIGLGTGVAMNTVILAMQNTVEPNQMGVATAAGTFFRNLGGTAGTAVLLSVMFSQATAAILANYATANTTPAFEAASAAHPDQLQTLHDGLSNGLSDTTFLTGLNETLTQPFLDGFAHAMEVTALIAAAIAFVGLVFALVMKEQPLRALSGNASRASAQAAPFTPPTPRRAVGEDRS